MSSSWSDLPLDLLVSIRNKIPNVDLISFRSVCSQWRSAAPAPNPCPTYVISFNTENNINHLVLSKNKYRNHFIFLPFSLSPNYFFGSSNGWLVFIAFENETLHLFNPVSNRKLIFPPLHPKLLYYYKKVKPTVHDAYRLNFSVVVVSSSIDAGIAVAGIVEIRRGTNMITKDRRFVFCRHAYGDCQRWSLLMEGSKGIIDIALAGDDRFYALGYDWEFYMLYERPPLIKLMKFKLWLPKHILEPDPYNSSANKRIPITCCAMKKNGETDLKIYGYCRTSTFKGRYISLKIDVTKLCSNSNNIDVACDAKWSYNLEILDYRISYFTPVLREHHSMFNVKHRIKLS